MEQNPIYQGTQYVASNTATSNANVPRRLLFADEWEKNRHATTQALQGIEQALIERNNNTILLNQQAEAKQRDLDMTKEMKEALDKANGTDGSWYDANGKLNQQMVRDFVKKYTAQPTQWGKAVIGAEAQQKSAAITQAYQSGVQEAVEAAILANTKKRELQAYRDNMRLATDMKDWDSRDQIAADAVHNGVLTYQQAATENIESERGRLAEEIDACTTTEELLDKWYDAAFQQRLSDPAYSELREAMQRRINQTNSTQATTTGDYYELDPKTGKRKAVAGTVTPPDGAPWYIQTVMRQYNGKVPADIAFKAIQKYLSEEITEQNSTAKGQQQWNRARDMAKTLGVDDTEFNKAYDLRSKQIGFGGFKPEAVINNISENQWLDTTQDDENLPADLSEKDRAAKRAKIAADIRDSVLDEYNLWWIQNAEKKPPIRAQYAKLLEIARRRATSQPTFNAIDASVRRATSEYLKQEREVAKEIGRTNDRKRKTAELTKEFNEKNPTPTPWQVSTDIQFSYELAPTDGGTLPDSKTSNIIYLPKGVELPAKSANVATKNGKLGFTVEFRHADVDKPTPSRKLLRSMGMPTFSPASISWDGYNLEISDYEAEYPASLFPDDGLVPDDGTDPLADNDEPLPL